MCRSRICRRTRRSARCSTATPRRRKRTSTTTRLDAPSERASRAPLVTVALGLGGNLGDVEAALCAALAGLSAVLGPLRVADLYRSRPWAPGVAAVAQPPYLNTAALADTDLPPEAVLGLAKALELAAGRRPGPRYGPRPL
ncbi:MAG TPA: 2-amino-4-hydroxy-6-hydroxymethyldihydropteridine diphosphokinase, partial [Thermoanaerobaculia bacterium]|nr:2-amino-4-hydroxy-6-hydroxymethyldihydropteridine diphosphokinase [Thermoanaerobaculia bacterium]